MCLKHSLQLYLRCLHLFKLLVSVYMLVYGLVVSTDLTLHQAYGSDVLGVGILIAALGVIKPCNVVTGHYGSARHNKFALLVALAFDCGIGLVQFSLGISLLVKGTPLYDKALRRACARNTLEVSESRCRAYWRDDRTAGMRLAWMSVYFRAVRKNDDDHAKIITETASFGDCCGFGPPAKCDRIEDERSFPSELATDSFLGSDMLEQRVACSDDRVCSGGVNCWYPKEEGTCEHFAESDISNSDPLGCRYDFGFGSCVDRDVEDASRGCAWYFEEAMNAKIYGHGVTLIVTLLFEVLSVTAACCYCWKRKAHDVLPINYVWNEPWDPVKEGKLQLGMPQDGAMQADDDDDDDNDDDVANEESKKATTM